MRLGVVFWTSLAASAMFPLASAGAQSVPDDAPAPHAGRNEIEVRGKREIDKAIVADNIRELTTRIPVLDIVPRFFQPLCLHVIGPDLATNRIIADRITAAAHEAGLEKPKPKCRENALVIIVDQPEVLYNRLVQRRHGAVGEWGRDVSNRRLRDELESGKPAISWSRTIRQSGSLKYIAEPGEVPILWQPRASRIIGHIYRTKVLSVVVFDAGKIGTATPVQLGDYAAMHLLATPRRDIDFEAASARSILSLFADDPDLAPEGLMSFDRAYLQGIYSLGPNAWRGKVNRAVLAAYEAQCADEADDCQFVLPEADGS